MRWACRARHPYAAAMTQPPVLDGVPLDDLSDRGLLKATLTVVHRLEIQMSQMNEALGRLSTAVTEQRDRMQGQIDTLTEALEAERQAFASDEVQDEQTLNEARAQTDAAVAELQGGVDAVNQLAARVAEVQGEQPGGGEQPEPEPAPEPEPLPEDPASETPVDPSVPPSDQPVQ